MAALGYFSAVEDAADVEKREGERKRENSGGGGQRERDRKTY